MSTIEDRLTAALHARADLVTPDDLSLPMSPAPAPRRRGPWTYAALAAACAAAIAVPIVIAQDGDDDRPDNGPTEGLDWPISDDRTDHDVDGDGRPDRLTLRVREDDGSPGPARLDVRLTGGVALHRIFEYDARSWSLRDRVDLDGDGDHEIVVPRVATADPDVGAEVLSLEGGQLVPAEVDAGAPFALAADEEGHARDLWVDVDVNGLFSSRSVESFERVDGQLVAPDSYRVEAWRWTLDDGRLVPQAVAEPWCRERQSGQLPFPQPCDGGAEPEGGTIELPRSPDQIVVGESWRVELDGDGLDTVALEGPADREYWEDGEVELVVTLTHTGTHRIPLPASYYLFVPMATIAGRGDGVDLLVGSSGGDAATYTIYGFWNGEFGERSPAVEEPALADFEGGEQWQRTDIATDGRLVTLQGTLEGGPDRARAWEWAVDVEVPVPMELGNYCRLDDEVTWVPCS